jgi:hypothetical protein
MRSGYGSRSVVLNPAWSDFVAGIRIMRRENMAECKPDVAKIDVAQADSSGVEFIKGHYEGTGGDVTVPLPGMENPIVFIKRIKHARRG